MFFLGAQFTAGCLLNCVRGHQERLPAWPCHDGHLDPGESDGPFAGTAGRRGADLCYAGGANPVARGLLDGLLDVGAPLI